ncbi:MAG: DUF1588 domain-containing protein [Myxococcales bacterium]|nr:DUF1588 domain-containing protein [Myxococcales bacterium]
MTAAPSQRLKALALVCGLWVLGCEGVFGASPDVVEDAGNAGAGPEHELAVFTREVWTPLRADCIACHQTGRAFAHDAPETARDVALGLVRFDSPNDSLLALRSENLHCGVSSCAPGAGRRARLAEGIRLWGLARGHHGGTDGRLDAGASVPPDYTEFQTCTPARRGSEDVARRLSKLQYVNTLLAGFNEPGLLAFNARSAVLHERQWTGALVSAIAQLPEDGEASHLPREDVRLSDTHLEGLLAIAQGVSDYYANRPTRLSGLGGACLSERDPSEACVRAFIQGLLGRRLLSRPLAASEVDEWYARFASGTDSPRERVLELVRAFALHPELVFGLSWQGPLQAGTSDVQALTAYEFARRLAWHYTDGPPSAQLYADAQSGAILTEPMTLERHLDGFVAPNGGSFRFPLSAHHFTAFAFLEQWLDTGGFRGFPSGALAASAFPGLNFQAGNENWYGEARDELYSFGFRQLFVERGTYASFFTDTSGETGPFTSRLYGGSAGVQDLGPNRPGVLSRVGYLASGDVYPNQIMFGVGVMRNVLCQPLPAPDPGALPDNFRDLGLRDAHPTWTTRQFVAQQTAAPACQGCHQRINPIGATISRYDGAGGFDRHQGVERIWSTSSNAQIVGTPMLDEAARITLDGQLKDVVGLPGLTQAIAASDEGPLCLARTAFTFALRRRPTPQDACTLVSLSNAARTQSLAALWKGLGRSEAFRTRRIVPREP